MTTLATICPLDLPRRQRGVGARSLHDKTLASRMSIIQSTFPVATEQSSANGAKLFGWSDRKDEDDQPRTSPGRGAGTCPETFETV